MVLSKNKKMPAFLFRDQHLNSRRKVNTENLSADK